MNQREFNMRLHSLLSLPYYMRDGLLEDVRAAFAEKQHEIDLLKAELKMKAEPEPVRLNKPQLEWMVEYFDNDPYPTEPIEVKNSPNGTIMYDPSVPGWG